MSADSTTATKVKGGDMHRLGAPYAYLGRFEESQQDVRTFCSIISDALLRSGYAASVSVSMDGFHIHVLMNTWVDPRHLRAVLVRACNALKDAGHNYELDFVG